LTVSGLNSFKLAFKNIIKWIYFNYN